VNGAQDVDLELDPFPCVHLLPGYLLEALDQTKIKRLYNTGTVRGGKKTTFIFLKEDVSGE
jgi:hypothetical protein